MGTWVQKNINKTSSRHCYQIGIRFLLREVILTGDSANKMGEIRLDSERCFLTHEMGDFSSSVPNPGSMTELGNPLGGQVLFGGP